MTLILSVCTGLGSNAKAHLFSMPGLEGFLETTLQKSNLDILQVAAVFATNQVNGLLLEGEFMAFKQ